MKTTTTMNADNSTNPPTEPAKKMELEVREILAFELYLSEDHGVADERENWRSDSELRITWRNRADAVIEDLQHAGLSVRVSSSKKLQSAIDELIIRPAVRAYSVADDA